MASQRHLADAPIKEAMIDLRVALPQDAALNQLEAVYDRISDRFPVRKIIYEGRFGVRFASANCERTETVADHTRLGFRYETEDGGQIVQFALNGFTYSRLAPYRSWEEMRDSARALWQDYLEAVAPLSVTRVATRFVNLIRIPIPFNDFSEYLTESPGIPEQLPQDLASYLTRVVLPVPDMGATAVITQALEPTPQEAKFASILLDIDTFLNHDFDANDAAIWDRMEDLRKLKNEIFFGSITEKTVELCQ